MTITYELEKINSNKIYIKRDDLFPFSFGGNKARKGMMFWEDIKRKEANYIVTYGSSASNHCRVIANIAASSSIPCCIISPEEIAHDTFNKKMMTDIFNAEIVNCKLSEVHKTIEDKISELRSRGYNPYFIQGGGHGNIGTQSYVNCYEEICQYERENGIHFDYIFHASGTGTTQAGLICGQLINNDDRKIIGISIARKNPRGRDVIIDSVYDYLTDIDHKFMDADIENVTIFDDTYTSEGYGKCNAEIDKTIVDIMCNFGIPMDETYTGKAFYGMKRYIIDNDVHSKNILFIHTGGTPLFFDKIINICNNY